MSKVRVQYPAVKAETNDAQVGAQSHSLVYDVSGIEDPFKKLWREFIVGCMTSELKLSTKSAFQKAIDDMVRAGFLDPDRCFKDRTYGLFILSCLLSRLLTTGETNAKNDAAGFLWPASLYEIEEA
jgi:hypothetical protein